MDDNIDYEKLASLVAHKLSYRSNASVQGQAALDELWLNQAMADWASTHSSYIAQYVCSTHEFAAAFRANLKSAINTVY